MEKTGKDTEILISYYGILGSITCIKSSTASRTTNWCRYCMLKPSNILKKTIEIIVIFERTSSEILPRHMEF